MFQSWNEMLALSSIHAADNYIYFGRRTLKCVSPMLYFSWRSNSTLYTSSSYYRKTNCFTKEMVCRRCTFGYTPCSPPRRDNGKSLQSLTGKLHPSSKTSSETFSTPYVYTAPSLMPPHPVTYSTALGRSNS